MKIPQISSRLRVIRSRSHSGYFYKTKCHHSCAFTYRLIVMLFHLNVKDDNILDKFAFERSDAKVKVTVANFRKTLSSF